MNKSLYLYDNLLPYVETPPSVVALCEFFFASLGVGILTCLFSFCPHPHHLTCSYRQGARPHVREGEGKREGCGDKDYETP